jgi:serine/threonine protein kinase
MADRYLITRRLGKGATATVYEAESLNISRRFAVKVVDLRACKSGKDPQLVRARLDREVEAISRLGNPHTVPFYEVLELTESCVGVVMKYVQGLTLDKLLARDGGLDWRRACRLLRQIANGVYEAHEVGLIHRDLKPANIMVEQLSSGDEFIHVLDFGIVWMDDGLEVTQGFVGTPLYASPEQALGEPVDRRSDIYALGALFFQMLTGRPPFESNNVIEVLRMHVRQEPPPVRRVALGHVPLAVQNLIGRMLAKSREARPGHLSEIIDELDAILRQEPELVDAAQAAGPPSNPYKPAVHPPEVREVEQTAPGLGFARGGDAPSPDRAVRASASTHSVLGGMDSEEVFDDPFAALDPQNEVESLGNPDSFFESEERDHTGPKAAIFIPRPNLSAQGLSPRVR